MAVGVFLGTTPSTVGVFIGIFIDNNVATNEFFAGVPVSSISITVILGVFVGSMEVGDGRADGVFMGVSIGTSACVVGVRVILGVLLASMTGGVGVARKSADIQP
jgi:hypothetical protein